MPNFKYFSSLCLIFISVCSCSKLKLTYNSNVLECGVEARDSDYGFIKISDQEGAELNSDSLSKLEVEFQTKDLPPSIPKITSNGCIKLPRIEGLLLIRAPNLGQSFASSIQVQDLQKIQLQTYPRLDTKLNCQNSQLFVNQSMTNVWTIKQTGNITAATIEIRVVDTFGQSSFKLFEKARGEVLDDFPSVLNFANIPEGVYRLEATFQNPADGWQAAPLLLNQGQECLVTVLHSTPEGVRDLPSLSKVNPGDSLPWNSKTGNLLSTCFEPIPSLSSRNSCHPKSHCLDPKNFVTGTAFAPADAGIYQGYSYLSDKAGNTSEVACQTLIVTSEAPHLTVVWQKDRYNRDPSVMDAPEAAVEARIYTQHPLLSQADAEASLQCKVEFLAQGQGLVDGGNVVCMNGRCKGMTMEDFVPCDSLVRVSLTRAWNQLNIGNSTLRLRVKAQDGVGHFSEVLKSIGIRESRWAVESLPYFKDGEAVVPVGVHPLREGGFLLQGKKSEVVRWRADEWREIPHPIAKFEKFHVFTVLDGTTWGSWKYSVEGDDQHKSETLIARFEGDGWVPFETLMEDLNFYSMDGKNGFFYSNNNYLLHVEPKGIVRLALSQELVQAECFYFYDPYSEINYAACSQKVYVYEQDSWKAVGEFIKEADEKFYTGAIDSKGRILVGLKNKSRRYAKKVAVFDPKSKRLKVFHFSKNIPNDQEIGDVKRVQEVGTDAVEDDSNIGRAFIISEPSGTLRIGQLFWDTENEIWIDGTDVNGIFPVGGNTNVFVNSSTCYPIWYFMDSEGTFVQSKTESFFISKRVFPYTSNQAVDVDLNNGDYYWFGTSIEGGIPVIVRMQKRKSYLLGAKQTGLPENSYFNQWKSPNGHLNIASLYYREILSFYDNAWNRRRNLGEGKLIEKIIDQKNGDTVYISIQGTIYLAPKGADALVILESNTNQSIGHEAHEDRLNQVWYRNGSSDAKRILRRISGSSVLSFTLPEDSKSRISGFILLDDQLLLTTKDFSIYSKSIAGLDPLVRIDPSEVGLLNLVSLRENDDILYAHMMESGDVLMQVCRETKPSGGFKHCIRTASYLWSKRTHQLQSFTMPYKGENVEISGYYNEGEIFSRREGEFFARSENKIFKLVQGKWQDFFDIGAEQKTVSKFSKITKLFFDDEGRIWIPMSGPENFVVYDP